MPEQYKQDLDYRVIYGKYRMVGMAPIMWEEVYNKIGNVAKSDVPVLISGETGVGKELVAQAIHRESLRAEKPLITVNCSAIPHELLESELYGHKRGAFSGASYERRGLFAEADGSTLYLDEIGEMSPALQAKLLRAVENGEIRRVGMDEILKVDVRLVCTTNRDLARARREGTFRNDLYYRLAVETIKVPPLRSRQGDIRLLIEHFLQEYQHRYGKTVAPFTQEEYIAYMEYKWPGNVRELRNSIENIVRRNADKIEILNKMKRESGDASEQMSTVSNEAGRNGARPLKEVVTEAERNHLFAVLELCGGSKAQAARMLGVDYKTLYEKLKKYDGQGVQAPRRLVSKNYRI